MNRKLASSCARNTTGLTTIFVFSAIFALIGTLSAPRFPRRSTTQQSVAGARFADTNPVFVPGSQVLSITPEREQIWYTNSTAHDAHITKVTVSVIPAGTSRTLRIFYQQSGLLSTTVQAVPKDSGSWSEIKVAPGTDERAKYRYYEVTIPAQGVNAEFYIRTKEPGEVTLPQLMDVSATLYFCEDGEHGCTAAQGYPAANVEVLTTEPGLNGGGKNGQPLPATLQPVDPASSLHTETNRSIDLTLRVSEHGTVQTLHPIDLDTVEPLTQRSGSAPKERFVVVDCRLIADPYSQVSALPGSIARQFIHLIYGGKSLQFPCRIYLNNDLSATLRVELIGKPQRGTDMRTQDFTVIFFAYREADDSFARNPASSRVVSVTSVVR